MKVLIVHCGKENIYGGAELVIVELIQHLALAKNVCTYVTTHLNGGMKADLEGWGEIVETGSYQRLWREVQDRLNWADVVNVHNFPATLTTFPKKVPTVYMCNEPAELFTNWWRKPIEIFNRGWVRKSGMKVVVADEFNAKRFKKIYGVEPRIIPYGVDYEFWSRNAGVERNRHFTMLQVGDITLYKNQVESLRTLMGIKDRIPEAKLVLVGERHPDSDAAILTGTYEIVGGLMGRVEYTGQLLREKVREWYNRAHVLVHPVREQGGWLAPFEAMCVGLPVITMPSFSASNLITKHSLGIVTQDMIDAILNREYEKLDIEMIKEWVRENLTWDKFCEGMVNIFEEVTRCRLRGS